MLDFRGGDRIPVAPREALKVRLVHKMILSRRSPPAR
jgi:hypothetical protein